MKLKISLYPTRKKTKALCVFNLKMYKKNEKGNKFSLKDPVTAVPKRNGTANWALIKFHDMKVWIRVKNRHLHFNEPGLGFSTKYMNTSSTVTIKTFSIHLPDECLEAPTIDSFEGWEIPKTYCDHKYMWVFSDSKRESVFECTKCGKTGELT